MALTTHLLGVVLFCTRLFNIAFAGYETIERDLCIIGGGSSGTYTAIQLQRHGKSVALVEQHDHLGGNVNTYKDPVTGETLDIGVIVFSNISVVTDYLEYLEIPLTPLSFASSGVSIFADFAKGKKVSASTTEGGNVTAALEAYQVQLDKYPHLTNGFNLPTPIPSDLLLPFGEFIKKHDLGALAYSVAFLSNQGVGNILEQLTLNMMKYFSRSQLESTFAGEFLTTKHHNNQQIYDKALAKLGSSAFSSSNVVSVKRSPDCVEISIDTPNGRKLIKSKKLVVAIRPMLDAVSPWLDLRPTESSLFAKLIPSYYWCSLIANSGIPANTSLSNANPKLPHSIPELPGLYGITATGLPRDLYTIYYSSNSPLSKEEVQSDILDTIARLRKGLGFAAPVKKTEFVFWHQHHPFFLTAPKDAVEAGFYDELEALQGEHRTMWTGAAWQTESSSDIWNFTQTRVLPELLRDLE